METLGYKACHAEGALWYKPMVRLDNNFEYYAYIQLHVDDALEIHHDGMSALK
jgi:hypothetical protein